MHCFDVLEDVADGGFENFEKSTVGVGRFIFGAFDVTDQGAGIVIGDGDGADGA